MDFYPTSLSGPQVGSSLMKAPPDEKFQTLMQPLTTLQLFESLLIGN